MVERDEFGTWNSNYNASVLAQLIVHQYAMHRLPSNVRQSLADWFGINHHQCNLTGMMVMLLWREMSEIADCLLLADNISADCYHIHTHMITIGAVANKNFVLVSTSAGLRVHFECALMQALFCSLRLANSDNKIAATKMSMGQEFQQNDRSNYRLLALLCHETTWKQSKEAANILQTLDRKQTTRRMEWKKWVRLNDDAKQDVVVAYFSSSPTCISRSHED